jgi:UDP-N-acetylglucosamine 2-epimerase
MSIVGARPQFVKIAPVSRAIAARNQHGAAGIEDLLLHTGQHYDAGLSEIFFTELGLPHPAVQLSVGSGSHGIQTARMLEGIEKAILDMTPDVVVVYGDTNSTIAGALAAAKLLVPVVHVEAGLRSFNRAMPEEINRVAVDHISDVLLAPTPTAMLNLAAERLADRAIQTGDVMLDAVEHALQRARAQSTVLEDLGLVAGGYGVVTIHRAESTRPGVLAGLLAALREIAERHTKLVMPLHPRTRDFMAREMPNVRLAGPLLAIEPLGHYDMLALVESARLVLTDSGGLQKEAFFLGCPCVTLRTETEWIETVDAGGNLVAGTKPEAIVAAAERWLESPPTREALTAARRRLYGDGRAAERILDACLTLVRG